MKNEFKKILLCVCACSPGAGSEPALGWRAYQVLRRRHQVHVICSGWSRKAIQTAALQGAADFSDFTFIPEIYSPVGKPAVDKWLSWLNISHFQKTLSMVGQRAMAAYKPDVIHQVTIASWRIGNPLAGRGVPFVWGPIGGGESLPMSFLGGFSLYSKLFEILRACSGWLACRQKLVKNTAKTADYIFAGNRETLEVVTKLRGSRAGTEVLPVVFFSPEKMRKFRKRAIQTDPSHAPLQIFSGGYVEARKGIGLALRALARLKQRGFAFQYENSGIGPEKAHLEAQIRVLGLAKCVRFVGEYPGETYDQKLRASDIFLFPSLRDNCPATLLEAMGYGCVPVVADHAGPGEMVTPECGIKIPVTRPEEFVDRLAEELAGLFQDADRRRRLGEAARLRVIENFSQEHWLQRVEAAYQKVTAGTRRS
ncbi:MAG: glycosyltransferase [Verrucomicrobia bacterium]|nr:glycosyltransferase [Verrucomicrobiota bacterium]